jgi:hypothetical protein
MLYVGSAMIALEFSLLHYALISGGLLDRNIYFPPFSYKLIINNNSGYRH